MWSSVDRAQEMNYALTEAGVTCELPELNGEKWLAEMSAITIRMIPAEPENMGDDEIARETDALLDVLEKPKSNKFIWDSNAWTNG